MVNKKFDAKTLMNIFFGTILVIVLGAWFITAIPTSAPIQFNDSLIDGGNYSGTIVLNLTTALNSTATSFNVTCFYNASGGPIENLNMTNTANFGNLTPVMWNGSAGGNGTNFTRIIDISSLSGRLYNVSCIANNGSSQNWTSVKNVTFDSIPPAVNFTSTTSSVVNNGNYTSANAGNININVSAYDVVYGVNFTFVYINVTNSSGGRAPKDNWTRARNKTSIGVFYNTTINVTDYPDGKYNITVYANDSMNDTLSNAVHLNNSEYIQITIDDTAPSSVVLTRGTGSTKTQNVITITAIDAAAGNGSGIDQCTVGGSNIAITGRGTGTQTLTHTGLNCGTSYSYIVTCYDQVGHSSNSDSTSFSTLSCSDSSSPGVEGPSTTVEKKNVIAAATPGEEVVLSNFQEDMGVKEIKVTVKEAASNVKITVKKFDTQPEEITVSKAGNVHKYLQIESENLGDKLDKATLTIKVQKDWLLDNNIDKANIALYRFDESAGKWDELSTVYKEEDDSYYYYDVQLTSFSYFAIAEKGYEEEEEAAAGNLLWLWITIGVILVAVIVGGGFAAKKRKK